MNVWLTHIFLVTQIFVTFPIQHKRRQPPKEKVFQIYEHIYVSFIWCLFTYRDTHICSTIRTELRL